MSHIAKCHWSTLAIILTFLTVNANAECLQRNNEQELFGIGNVYVNGQLKFRIDAWQFGDDPPYDYNDVTKITVRSTAPQLNGVLSAAPNNRFLVVARDNQLCPGTEITVTCAWWPVPRNWRCTFSQF
jgi:hypothetical protein